MDLFEEEYFVRVFGKNFTFDLIKYFDLSSNDSKGRVNEIEIISNIPIICNFSAFRLPFSIAGIKWFWQFEEFFLEDLTKFPSKKIKTSLF